MSKRQAKEFIRKEIKRTEKRVFERLDQYRRKINKLEKEIRLKWK